MSNLEIIQELYEAFASGGLDRIHELVDSDCVVTQDEALPWGGRFEGHEGVATFGASLGGTIHSTLTNGALFEAGDQVVQFGRSRGTVLANNAVFDVPEVHVWTLRSGLVTAAAFYLDSSAMIRALAQAS